MVVHLLIFHLARLVSRTFYLVCLIFHLVYLEWLGMVGMAEVADTIRRLLIRAMLSLAWLIRLELLYN